MSYEDLLQELLKMSHEDRKQNVVMVQRYGGNVFHPIYLDCSTSILKDWEYDWEIVLQ
jgi:hypothetical protein